MTTKICPRCHGSGEVGYIIDIKTKKKIDTKCPVCRGEGRVIEYKSEVKDE